MNQAQKESLVSISRGVAMLVGIAVILAGVGWGVLHLESLSSPQPAVTVQSVASVAKTSSPPILTKTNATKQVLTNSVRAVLANYPDFKKRPLPVAYESTNSQWTLADGKDTNVIRQLAHNDLEYVRMVEENSRIIKRQLVYRKETVPQLLQQLLPVGQPLQSFTLPGVDGLEVQVEVTDTHVNGMAQSGSVIGRIKGQFNSMVSVGFYNGCESYNIISPDQNLYFVANAREPGEVIVKQIDPAVYNPPTGNAPDYVLIGQKASTSEAPKTMQSKIANGN